MKAYMNHQPGHDQGSLHRQAGAEHTEMLPLWWGTIVQHDRREAMDRPYASQPCVMSALGTHVEQTCTDCKHNGIPTYK